MADEYRPNKLLDDTPYDGGRSEPDYPNIFGEVDILGNSKIRYADPDKPDKAFSESIGYAGNWKTEEANGLKNELNFEVRSYTSGGHSHNSDGQHALYSKSNINVVASQDVGLTAAGTTYKGSGEQEVGGAAQGSFHHDTNGSTFRTSSGDLVQYFDGSVHYGANDFVIGTTGQRIENVAGEYWVYAQGNIDIGGDQKLQIHSEGALNINTTATMEIRSSESMNVISSSTMTINSSSTMALNSTEAMTVNSAATMNVSSSDSMTVTSPTDIKVKCGIAELMMDPSSAKLSVGPIASIEMNSGTITIKCGASVIVMTAGGIDIATPALAAQSLGGAIINSAGPMVVTSESEGVFGAAGQVQLAGGGTAAVFAPVVFIG